MQVSNDNLPKSMRYGLTSATAVSATTRLAKFSSNNGNSFSPTGANEIRIRIKADGFMDVSKHYLQFTITTANAPAFVDTHAGSFFDRMTIESNGAIIEQINSYGLYNAIRQNYNQSLDDVLKTNVQSGAGKLGVEQSVGAFGLAGADTAAAVKVVSDAFLAATNGLNLSVNKAALGQELATASTCIFTIQLESGLFKNHHNKALPDGLGEIELVLRLASSTQAMVGLAVAGPPLGPIYTLSEPALFCPVYMIQNADVMASYRNVVASEGVMISGDTAKTYINSIPNTATVHTLQINDRSLSCKGLVTALRLATADSSQTIYSNGAFGITGANNTQNARSYKYMIGGVNYPQTDVAINPTTTARNLGRMHEESLKALAKHGEHYANSVVSQEQLVNSVGVPYASATSTSSFTAPRGLVSVSLKKFSDDGLRMIGLNTSQNSSPNVLELDIGVAFGAALNATTFSICEAFYQMDGLGGLTVAI